MKKQYNLIWILSLTLCLNLSSDRVFAAEAGASPVADETEVGNLFDHTDESIQDESEAFPENGIDILTSDNLAEEFWPESGTPYEEDYFISEYTADYDDTIIENENNYMIDSDEYHDSFICEDGSASVEADYFSAETMASGEIVSSGDCGQNAAWTLNTEGTLIISGSGEIKKEADADWTEVRNVVIHKGISRIGDYTFSGCSNLLSVQIPYGVIYIGACAFSGCTSMASLEIPDSVLCIGAQAFYSCSALTSIEIPSSVTAMGCMVFGECSSLESIEMSSNITHIGTGDFYGCKSLTSLNIPSGITEIWDYAFAGCSSLQSVIVPEGVTALGSGVFQECSSLVSLTLPNGISMIPEDTFWGCSSLVSIEIPSSVKTIAKRSFAFCTSLKEMELRNNIKEIEEYAFYGCSGINKVIFSCKKPVICSNSFIGVTADAYYIIDDSWEKVESNCGGGIFTWHASGIRREIEEAIISVSYNSCKYDGNEKKPKVVVDYHGTRLTNGSAYTLTYKNNKYVGTAIITIAGKGIYTGKVTKTFTIISPGKVKVSLDANGGVVEKTSKSVSRGAKYGTLPEPKRKGYSFLGWYTSKTSGSKKESSTHVTASQNHILYAKWKKKTYSIQYNLNGGKNSGRNPEHYTVSSNNIDLYAPSKKGYRFSGWYSDNQYTKKVSYISKGSTGTKVFYAKWTPYVFYINFNGNGSNSSQMPSMKMKYGLCYNLPGNVYKAPSSSLEFAGWSLTRNGSVTFKNRADISIKDLVNYNNYKLMDETKVTLWAKWRRIYYKITYKLDGGKNPDGAATEFHSGQEVKLPTPVKKGYIFKGWYSGTKKVTVIAKGTNKNQCFTAKWEPIKYTIRFDGNGVLNDVPTDLQCTYDKNEAIPQITDAFFGSWTTNQDGSGSRYYGGDIIKNLLSETGTVILYAQSRNTVIMITDYSAGFSKGTIRYVYQLDNFKENGWGAYEKLADKDCDGDPTRECGFASQSMALSYIGKDISPEWLCNKKLTYYTSYCYEIEGVAATEGSGIISGSASVEKMNRMLNNFVRDGNKGIYSPVIVHYANGSNSHTILVLGKTASGSYIILDTAKSKETFLLNISEEGVIFAGQDATHDGGNIVAVQQYYIVGN